MEVNKQRNSVESAFFEANKLLSIKGKTFYWARFLLNKNHAQRATRLYRFCRYVDDLADEASSVSVAKQNLKQLSIDINQGHSEDLVVLDALQLFNECNIEKAIVLELIKGVYSDLTYVRMQDQDQLMRYCYQVAGTVGLMMCRVLDVQDKTAYPFAIDLGIAMQLTNICRDVSEDAAMGRRYLPASLVANLEPAELISPSPANQQKLKQALACMLGLADTYYKSGNAGLPFITLRARTGILIASKLYQAIGIKLRRQDYNFWHNRAMLSRLDKIVLTIKTLFRLLFTAEFWRVANVHDKKLHEPLKALPNANAN